MTQMNAPRLYTVLGVLALAQMAGALGVAWAEPNMLRVLPPLPGGLTLALILVALCSFPLRVFADRWLGKAPPVGPWWALMQAKIYFQIAMLASLSLLASIAGLAWLSDAPQTTFLMHALLELLIEGILLAFAIGIVANLLSLLQRRPR